LEDLLKVCMLVYKESWDELLPLVEFTYNNRHHSRNEMVLYEALYGRKWQTLNNTTLHVVTSFLTPLNNYCSDQF